MSARMDKCKSKGFDAIQPDNLMVYNQVFCVLNKYSIDVFKKNTGFKISYNDNVKYAMKLLNIAHSKNLAFGIDNSPEMVKDLVNDVCFSCSFSSLRQSF
jgi:hypothetical protein